ncbi:MAG: prepilin-type N-terminal cleavage/methylation domain-containing protein [bacterium]
MNRRAFTLIEVLVSITIFMLILGIAVYSFFGVYRMWKDYSLVLYYEENISSIAGQLISDIHISSKIESSSDIDNLILDTDDGVISYYYSDGALKRKGQNIAVADCLDECRFFYPNADMVQVEIKWGSSISKSDKLVFTLGVR